MKFLRLIHAYLKGIRASAAVLSLIFLWALFSAVSVYGRIRYIRAEMDVIESAHIRNAGVLTYQLNEEDMKTRAYERKVKKAVDALRQEPLVQQVYSIRVVNPVSCDGISISIVLYDPGLFSFFPAIGENMVSEYKNGCILGSTALNSLNTGQSAQLKVQSGMLSVTVAGHLSAPYRMLRLNQSSSRPTVAHLFTEANVLIMEATDSLLSELEQLSASIAYDQNLIVVFTPDATPEQIAQLMKRSAPEHNYDPFEDILDRSQENIDMTLKEQLPRPLFLTLSALICYFSILILTLKKKERQMAVLHLCGMSRKKYAALTLTACQCFTLLPSLLMIALLWAWPHISWINIDSREMSYTMQRILLLLEGLSLDLSGSGVVAVYYAFSVLFGTAVTAVYLWRHSPVSYLRGAQ